jgi:NAD(P)-dependent dehydrogenase (short-subunit alcohol dehydrogenase family)
MNDEHSNNSKKENNSGAVLDFDQLYLDVDLTEIDAKAITDLEECRYLVRECNSEIVRINGLANQAGMLPADDFADLRAYKAAKVNFEGRAATLNAARKEAIKKTVSGSGDYRNKFYVLVSCINKTLHASSARAVFEAFSLVKIHGEDA